MDSRLRDALINWKARSTKSRVKLVPESVVTKSEGNGLASNSANVSHTARAQFELPDGGRFYLIVTAESSSTQTSPSMSTNSSPSPLMSFSSPSPSLQLTAMVEDGLGLPDGFLMDINNYLFSDLADSPHTHCPHAFVENILGHASILFDKLTFEIRPNLLDLPSTSNSSQDRSVSPQGLPHFPHDLFSANYTHSSGLIQPKVRPLPPNPSTSSRTPPRLTGQKGATATRSFVQLSAVVDGASKRKRAAFSYAEPEFGESRLATTTLLKQISILRNMDTRVEGFVAIPQEENLYIWTVRLYFDERSASKLAADLAKLDNIDHVQLEFRFPSAYPNVPPVVRVVAPYLVGGHVAPHGGLCMELLTTSGWAPVNSIDAVCIQIRTMLIHGNARAGVARSHQVRNYTFEGALSDMRNIVRIHRWDTATDSGNSRRKVLRS